MIGADTTLQVQLELAELPAHALAPQILSDFIHVVTDPRRFQKPLTMERAIAKADYWWNAKEVQQVYSNAAFVRLFHDWMPQHRLGRKRILDTQLASTLWQAGVRCLITSNQADFQIFGFRLIVPET